VADQKRGTAFGLGAYIIWGLLPLYWSLLKPASALEILAHRVIWSAVFIGLLVIVLRRTAWLRTLASRRRILGILTVAAALVAVNWGTYIWSVNSGRVVEASLGYFINPLVSMLLGVAVLRERLRGAQWAAVGVGTLAVVVLTADYGRPPWIAFTLAGTFAVYGLLKKVAAAPAMEGLAVESTVSLPIALGYALWLELAGRASFGHVSVGHTLLVMASGVATALPLLLFAAAANRIPLTSIGILQYLAPLLQFAIGVLVVHEVMPPARWAGFVLVWLALAIFTADGIRHHRRQLVRVAEAVA
jgi:chloramphenicol-sensitive protein RarD